MVWKRWNKYLGLAMIKSNTIRLYSIPIIIGKICSWKLQDKIIISERIHEKEWGLDKTYQTPPEKITAWYLEFQLSVDKWSATIYSVPCVSFWHLHIPLDWDGLLQHECDHRAFFGILRSAKSFHALHGKSTGVIDTAYMNILKVNICTRRVI